MKSVEIYYNIADIPNISDRGLFSVDALGFRNEAMDLIEAALMNEDAGEWEGAESGQGEVNFGFGVEDFDRAEAIIHAAVKDTPYENIREIKRREFSEEDFEMDEGIQAGIKPMNFFEIIGLLVFKKMPKRFLSYQSDGY